MSTEVARYEPALPAVAHERSIEELVAQAGKIKQAMEQAMEVDQHYGIIPGARKPSLWKPGAEKLCLLFRLDPQYHSEPVAPDAGGGGHLTVKSVCTLYHIPTGQRFGSGEASCSTRESKYAYRQGKRACPGCGAETILKSKFPPKDQAKVLNVKTGAPVGAEPGWYCYAKIGGCGKEFAANDPAIVGQETGRVANEDLADSYNTVLKMANKRALVAGILNVTAASDVFTQDLEDFAREEADEPPVKRGLWIDGKPVPHTQPKAPKAPAAPAAPARVDAPETTQPTREGEMPYDDMRAGEGAPLNETLERSLLLAKCKGAADTAKLSAGQRADILVQFNIRDPREASLDQLTAMLDHLRGLVGGGA